MSRHWRHRHGFQHRPQSGCGSGPIHRVTEAIGKRFGFERRWVLIGFIVLAIMHFPLALILFLVAWFWADHPGKLERWWEQARDAFRPARPATAAGPDMAPDPEDLHDPFMDDLRRKFRDLEERAGRMEEHVASDEFELRREFRRMSDD